MFTATENQMKLWVPMNSITEKLYYTVNNGGTPYNQRIVISAPIEKPIVWQISKIEPTAHLGVQCITVKQDEWNHDLDYIDKDDKDDIFAMYANYFGFGVIPIDESNETGTCKVTSATGEIKLGGSYRTFTATAFDKRGKDVTDAIDNASWSVSIDGVDATEPGLFAIIDNGTKIKLKFLGDRSYLTKTVTVSFSCTYKGSPMSGTTDVTIIAM